MIGELIFKGRDGQRSMRLGGVATLVQLTALATALQPYTNAAIIQARLWVPQTLTGMNAPATETGFDFCTSKAVMAFVRTGQPNGKGPVARLNWPAPKGAMFDLVAASKGDKGGGYRVKSTVGLSFASAINAASNRTLTFHKGWLREN